MFMNEDLKNKVLSKHLKIKKKIKIARNFLNQPPGTI